MPNVETTKSCRISRRCFYINPPKVARESWQASPLQVGAQVHGLRRAGEGYAQQLAKGVNAEWALKLGALRCFDGFQIQGSLYRRGRAMTFSSVLFGGRFMVGTEPEVIAACSGYVASRRRKVAG